MQTITIRHDTKAWKMQVWVSFFAAAGLCAIGLAWLPVQMEINPAYKAFLGVSWLFLISSCFTLAKTLRDAHENALAESAQTRVSVCASCELG